MRTTEQRDSFLVERTARQREQHECCLIERPAFHVAVLIAGSIFVLAVALHGNVWFDEAYSIALAQHSFSEIWSIGSNDVHPVLYYLLLHVVVLLFGSNVIALRVFTACGFIALAALGYTHLRRDFDARTGMWFSALALFAPAAASIATQVRMYSWAAFAVSLIAIYAWRIAQRICGKNTDGATCESATPCEGTTARKSADGNSASGLLPDSATTSSPRSQTVIPIHWWIILFASSAAAAHLHYFAAIAAFVICAFLLVVLIAHRREHRRALVTFAIGAVCAVGTYVPWLLQLLWQISWVSSGFWISFDFPESLIEVVFFPLVSADLILAWEGGFGDTMVIIICVLVALAILFWILLFIHSLAKSRSLRAESPAARSNKTLRLIRTNPAVCAAAVIVGVALIAIIAGCVINQTVLYYRYMYVCLGPASFAGAYLLARTRSRALLSGVCVTTTVLSIASFGLLASTAYSSQNEEAPLYYQKTAATVAQANDSDEALVVSADIGIASVLSILEPDIPIVYLDIYGNGSAYEAFAPTIDIVDDWSILDGSSANDESEGSGSGDGFSGQYILLSTNGEEGAESFAAEHDSIVVSSETISYPYQLLTFTISVLERTG